MTIIAAYDDGSTVWIGSDSCAIAGDTKTEHGSKLIRFKNYCIGYAESYRVSDILKEAKSIPRTIKSTKGIRKLRDIIREAMIKYTGSNAVDWEREDQITHPVLILIACPLGIYEIQEDYAILKHKGGYATIGSGGDYALGALAFARENDMIYRHGCSGKDVVAGALKITKKHCTSVGGRTHIAGIPKE